MISHFLLLWCFNYCWAPGSWSYQTNVTVNSIFVSLNKSNCRFLQMKSSAWSVNTKQKLYYCIDSTTLHSTMLLLRTSSVRSAYFACYMTQSTLNPKSRNDMGNGIRLYWINLSKLEIAAPKIPDNYCSIELTSRCEKLNFISRKMC